MDDETEGPEHPTPPTTDGDPGIGDQELPA